MVRISAACFAVVIGSLPLLADNPTKVAEVKKLVEALGDANIKGDYAKVIDLTYDGVVKILGGRAEAIKNVEAMSKGLSDKGITMKSFTVGIPGDFLTEGDNTFVIVPTTIELAIPGGKALIKAHQLGISIDSGKTWKFTDCAGLDNKAYRERVFPKLPAKLKLPEKSKPEIIKN